MTFRNLLLSGVLAVAGTQISTAADIEVFGGYTAGKISERRRAK